MPCWEMNLVTLKFNAKNIDLIVATLERMNMNPVVVANGQAIATTIGSFDLRTGEVKTDDYNIYKVNRFKVEYSKSALMVAAKKNKWVVKKRAPQKFVAKKW